MMWSRPPRVSPRRWVSSAAAMPARRDGPVTPAHRTPAGILPMNVTPESVRQLRERTGAGIMECKKALVETKGDLDAAAELMRKQGLAKADKKAARVAAEGTIAVHRSGASAAMIEVNCETDFVARSEEFQAFARDVAHAALEHPAPSVE